MESKPDLLHKKLPDLQKSEEVQDAVEKHTRLTGEKVPNNPENRLQVYIDRLENIFLNEDEETRKRNLELLKPKIHEAFIIKRENVPESYFELQKRIARERGQTVEEIPPEVRERMIDVLIEDQVQSLDNWIDYLSSGDAVYPTWFKYFTFRNVVKLSQFDKELGKFKERTSSTVAPFPDIYREALAQVADLYQQSQKDKTLWKDPDFQAFISKKFPAQYAEKIQQTLEQSQESMERIDGEWVKYEKGNEEEALKLYQSLQGKGTGWCTAGQSTAQEQIEQGDFYVFYSNNSEGVPINPRLAIRMEDDDIAEVRGVLPDQEVEPILQETLESKLNSFGKESDKYKKKLTDMRRVTELEKQINAGDDISIDDIEFIFEINNEIEGFGYQKDPRIKELQGKIAENAKAAAMVEQIYASKYNLSPEELAYANPERITESTKLFIEYVTSYNPYSKGMVAYDLVSKNKVEFVKILKAIELKKKIMGEQTLTKEDLQFIWEGKLTKDDLSRSRGNISYATYTNNTNIELQPNKGYTPKRVFLIHDLQKERDITADYATINGVAKEEILTDPLEITERTKYDLQKGILGGRLLHKFDEQKVAKLAELAKKIKESGVRLGFDYEIEDGVSHVKINPEDVKDLEEVLSMYIPDEDSLFKETEFPAEVKGLKLELLERSELDVFFINTVRYGNKNEVIEDLEKIGLRPLTFTELLAYGLQNHYHERFMSLGTMVKIKDELTVPTITYKAYDDEDGHTGAPVLEFLPPQFDMGWFCLCVKK